MFDQMIKLFTRALYHTTIPLRPGALKLRRRVNDITWIPLAKTLTGGC